ncbi:MAG: FAD-binding protein, partial [Verrucomicrobia bacterium]|nr:FAD-binding protein [Verrucomicrobiota bacterium]
EGRGEGEQAVVKAEASKTIHIHRQERLCSIRTNVFFVVLVSIPITPTTPAELVEAVRSRPRVLAIGARTKPRLSQVPDDVCLISTGALHGIVEYEPEEFTFTALAGTSLREINQALTEKGQYLPFDPMLVEAGATLGGTVAAGLSGPGRFRFGGVRDFILGVRFVDGPGRLLRMGGKVVKNCAGFDLPKFFVGSLGRYGVLAEVTFKVFPVPASRLTLRLTTSDAEAAAKVLTEAANSRWELDALDLLPDSKTVCLRLAGPAPALEALSCEVLARWPGQVLSVAEADAAWTELREFRWAHSGCVLVKVAITPAVVPALYAVARSLEGTRIHVSAGGNVAFVSLPSSVPAAALQERLRALSLPAVCLSGNAPLWCGTHTDSAISTAVKQALDPQNRFPGLDD